MNIKKFEEYQHNMEGEIADEYAKVIISKFIDSDLDNVTLEEVFYDICKGDELEEHQDMVKESIIKYLESLLYNTKKIRTMDEIGVDVESNRYNL